MSVKSEWEILQAHMERCQYKYCDGFALAAAAYISRAWPSDPLWVLIVAPPGSGKSCTLMLFSDCPQIELLSSATPASFITAWGGNGEDTSLFARCHENLIVLKDLGTILSQGWESTHAIFSMLREAFDGQITRAFANVVRSYDLHFNIVAGATDAARGAAQLFQHLGERFVYFDLEPPSLSWPLPEIDPALKGIVAVWVAQFEGEEPSMTAYEDAAVFEMAELVALLRTIVSHNRTTGEITDIPRPEQPTRLAKQLRKLFMAVKMLSGDAQYAARLCQETALATVPQQRLQVLEMLQADAILSTKDVVERTGLGGSVCRILLNDMRVLGILQESMGDDTSDRARYYGIPTDLAVALGQRLSVNPFGLSPKLKKPTRPKKNRRKPKQTKR